MAPKDIALLVIGILAGVFAVILIVLSVKLHAVKKKAESGETHAEKIKIVKGVRYSEEDAITDNEGMNVTHTPNDFILVRNEVYRAERGGKLLPGMYTALSTNGGDRNFKLRIGGLVKNFVHGDSVVLGEGEEICAVSATVILR